MAKGLNPQTICNLFTLAQIQTKVDLWLDKLERASTRMYDKDSTQGRQKVESEELQRIESTLQSYLKALEDYDNGHEWGLKRLFLRRFKDTYRKFFEIYIKYLD